MKTLIFSLLLISPAAFASDMHELESVLLPNGVPEAQFHGKDPKGADCVLQARLSLTGLEVQIFSTGAEAAAASFVVHPGDELPLVERRGFQMVAVTEKPPLRDTLSLGLSLHALLAARLVNEEKSFLFWKKHHDQTCRFFNR